MSSRSNLCSARGTLLFIDTIIILNAICAKLMETIFDIKRVFVNLSAHRAEKTLFECFKHRHVNYLVLLGLKFLSLSLLQSRERIFQFLLLNLLNLGLCREKARFASQLIDIKD